MERFDAIAEKIFNYRNTGRKVSAKMLAKARRLSSEWDKAHAAYMALDSSDPPGTPSASARKPARAKKATVSTRTTGSKTSKPRKAKASDNVIKPHARRKVAERTRAAYDSDEKRAAMPLSHFLEKDRDYPYRAPDGRIDCNLVSAAIKRARLNKMRGVRGSAATLAKAEKIWNRVCRKYTPDASQ